MPDEVKGEFGLPEDMQDYEINFSEVRIHDASKATKNLVWSGQEVLSTSLNME